MPGLLYPAFQKFYSALSSLERFEKEKNFFDNISSLDNFFSEYRNITFVIQKSLAHSSYIDIYRKNRDKYLTDHWFVEKRNEIIKQNPFPLNKEIEVAVYSPSNSICIFSETYTVENDVSLNTLIDSIKESLIEINPIEVLFSAKFFFYEEEQNDNVLVKCLTGIQAMKEFMSVMYDEVGESCSLCDELIKKITDLSFTIAPLDMLMVNDYAYYPQKEEFERAQWVSLLMGKSITSNRLPLSKLNSFGHVANDDFQKFILMHVFLQSTELMPTIMTVYMDNTFALDSFSSNIKTTFYRKLNEYADQILESNVKELYYMTVYVECPWSEEHMKMTSKERLVQGNKEILAFMMVDCDLNEKEYVFDGTRLADMNYIVNKFHNGIKNSLDYGKLNLAPIIAAFKTQK